MKKFAKILAVALMATLALFLVSCSSYNKILKAYEKEDYVEVSTEDPLVKTINTTLQKILNDADEDGDSDIKVTVHFLKKGELLSSDIACILEFNGNKDVYDFIEQSETLKGMIKDAQNSEYINDNCILLPLASPAALNIFKNA